ncbi:CRIB domain-containing protein RIC4-like [Cynara cardunculus var. scolymus]|uniref:PAK-box/P21-Rho-binding n=1 Tax=Cynara cardunculus var. scolymus TaxID=59895 RepID=A0A118K4R0_CYNCS|nr:CRIB domain-containing protein RIC4-like [Cynara cardunculus var. scolymus]KVI07918.1 PAK-box/P21-Rho-binding [Cynara cardunculus var. scolymus]
MMKDRMERLVVFPFATGCVSASSIAVCVQHGRRPKEELNSSRMVRRSFDIPRDPKDEELGAATASENLAKGSFRFLALSKPNVSVGLHRLTRSIKNLSQSLVSKEEIEEAQMELEIGLPTDVKHVAHVGFDGSVTSDVNRHGNHTTSEFLGFCPISFAQLEERLAMCMSIDPSHDNTKYATEPSMA